MVKPVAKTSMEVNDQLLLLLRQEPSLQVGAEVVGPAEAAALAAAAEVSELGDSAPAALAVVEDEVDELLVLLGSPWALLHP